MLARRRALAAVTFLLAGLTVACLGNASIWHEYYGSGPPYYSQSTNMDKWQSPWPLFLAVNAAALSLLVLAALSRRRSKR